MKYHPENCRLFEVEPVWVGDGCGFGSAIIRLDNLRIPEGWELVPNRVLFDTVALKFRVALVRKGGDDENENQPENGFVHPREGV